MDVLKILILEDFENDAELIKRELKSGLSHKLTFEWVMNKNDFINALNNFHPDIILSDYNLPQFNGIEALKLAVKFNNLIPFIIVTGTLAEEIAADSIKEGAWDYVVKERLHRLPRAVENALKLKAEKIKVNRAETELSLIKEKIGIQLKLLYNAIDNASISFIITDSTGKIQYVNPKFEEVTGYQAGEVIGRNPNILKSGKHPKEFYSNLWNVILSGNEYRGEIINKRKNGELIWEQVLISPIKNEDGNIEHFVAIKQDITNEKKLKEELVANKEKYQNLVENINDVIFELDINGVITYISPTIQSITGYPSDFYTGKEFLKVIYDEDIEITQSKFENLITQNLMAPNEFRIKTKAGKVLWLRVSAKQIKTDGVLAGVRGLAIDVTSQKETEVELIKAKEKAEESDRLKSAFLATMSHELRTPLNAIIGFSDLIQENEISSEVKEMSRIISSSGNHLLNIIEDIFDISILQTKEMKIVKEEFKLSGLLESLKQYMQVELKKQGKEHLRMNFMKPDRNYTLYTDKTKVNQVLTNLLKNAIKFTDFGSIDFSFVIEKGKIIFSVTDTGIGIPKDKREIIFQQFRQVDDTFTRRHGGVGLGLAICKEIARVMNEEIWVESKVGIGSTFCFSLKDAVLQSPQANYQGHAETKRVDLSEFNILVVEDVESNYHLLKNYIHLTKAGVMWATNGEEAIEICRTNPDIHLVLMDIRMPGIDGFEATKIIKGFRPDLKIIAQTAFGMKNDREMAFASKCDDYLSKPIRLNDFISMLHKHLLG